MSPLSNEYQSTAANAICHAAEMSYRALSDAAGQYTLPHVIYKPRIFVDGDQWCALLGENLQSGICGFGSSPAKAMYQFDLAWGRDLVGEVK